MRARSSSAPWLRFSLRVPEAAAEVLGLACIELGAPGAVTGQRDLRRARPARRSGGSTRFEAYFPPRRNPRRLATELRESLRVLGEHFPHLARREVRLEPFRVPDYGRALSTHFPPLAVGRRLLICPPWAEPPRTKSADERIVLRIEPGRAFGTGHHPTTRGCLVAIERACAGGAPRRGLDVGSGSGVLAVAMRRLGIAEVTAVDTDPVAREATLAAAQANRASPVRVASRLSARNGRFDLIAANLYAALLVELAGDLRGRLAPAGRLIASGLLAGQEARVRRAFAATGLRVTRRELRSGWVVLELAAVRRVATTPVAR